MGKTVQAAAEIPTRNINLDALLDVDGEYQLNDLPGICTNLSFASQAPPGLKAFANAYTRIDDIIFNRKTTLTAADVYAIADNFQSPVAVPKMQELLQEQQQDTFLACLQQSAQLGTQCDLEAIKAACSSNDENALEHGQQLLVTEVDRLGQWFVNEMRVAKAMPYDSFARTKEVLLVNVRASTVLGFGRWNKGSGDSLCDFERGALQLLYNQYLVSHRQRDINETDETPLTLVELLQKTRSSISKLLLSALDNDCKVAVAALCGR